MYEMNYNYCYACKISVKKNLCEKNMEINLCSDCQNENFILINKTNAKKKFCLKDSDLKYIPKNIVYNKYNRLTTLYYYDDIVLKAHKKYGGASGLIYEQEKRIEKGKKIKDINRIKIVDRYNMIQCRRNLLFSELEKKKLNYYDNISEFYQYVDLGNESGYTHEDIIKIFIEYNFLYKKTNYKTILEKHKINFKNYEPEKLKYFAKKTAIINFISEKKENINNIPFDIIEKYHIGSDNA